MTQEEALKILKAGRNVFLTGSAGSGKTFVLNQYIRYLRDRDVYVAVTASTGIAATHLGGVTIHSWSGMGIKDDLSDLEIDYLIQKESLYKKYQKVQVLIIDEVSMLRPRMFDALNRLTQTMKGNQKPFGGIQVVLSGDFFQLPPIVKYGEESLYLDASEAWREMDLRVCYLEEQHRQTDEKLDQILNEIRAGEVSEQTHSFLQKIKGPKKFEGLKPTRLHTHNINVDAINEKELAQIDEPEQAFEIRTHGRPGAVTALVKGILAPEVLRLKKNAVVMFVKNNFERGYVNGTLGVVTGFEYNSPVVQTFSGRNIHVEPELWEIVEDGKIIASAEQLPLRLAWAITIHKSQGMSMDAAEIDLSQSFVPGQGYVALSRLRSLEGLALLGLNEMALRIDPYVLELNHWLKKESCKWCKVIERFPDSEMDKMASAFVKDCGGLLSEKNIKKNKIKNQEKHTYSHQKADGSTLKIPSHEITLDFVNRGMNMAQIASERGVKEETIISHLEKIKAGEYFTDRQFRAQLKAFKPNSTNLNEIRKVVKKKPDATLSTLYRNLGGKYSFEDLRLARLFL